MFGFSIQEKVHKFSSFYHLFLDFCKRNAYLMVNDDTKIEHVEKNIKSILDFQFDDSVVTTSNLFRCWNDFRKDLSFRGVFKKLNDKKMALPL